MPDATPQDVPISQEQTPVPVVVIDPSPMLPTQPVGAPPPVNVNLVTPRPAVLVNKADEQALAPTTTASQDKTTEGQRRVNLIWETTQSRIAIFVVGTGVIVNALVVGTILYFSKEVSVTQLALISICLQFINLTVGIVIGFYFSRTNHAAIGGVGPQPNEPYVGR